MFVRSRPREGRASGVFSFAPRGPTAWRSRERPGGSEEPPAPPAFAPRFRHAARVRRTGRQSGPSGRRGQLVFRSPFRRLSATPGREDGEGRECGAHPCATDVDDPRPRRLRADGGASAKDVRGREKRGGRPEGALSGRRRTFFRVRWAPRGDRPHEAAAQGLSPSPRGRPPDLSAPQFPSARRIRRFNDAPRHPVRAPPTRSVRDERKTGRTSGGRHRLRAGAPARPVRVREAYRLGRLSPRGARRNAEVVRDGVTHGVPGRFETLPTCGGARQGSAAADTAPIASCFEGRSESARDPEGGPEPRTVARGGEEPTSAARTPPASTKGRLTGVMPT